MENLKKYSKYLLFEYTKLNNNKGSLYWDLFQFYNEGIIKDVISKSNTYEYKVNILNLYRKDIIDFAKNFDIETNILTYKEFKDE